MRGDSAQSAAASNCAEVYLARFLDHSDSYGNAQMIDWNTFGSVVRIYCGSGDLCCGDDKVSCEFELVQLVNGSLLASCQVSDHTTALSLFGKQVAKLVGMIGENQTLTFSDNMIVKSINENRLIVSGKFVRVKLLEHHQPNSVRFALANLVMREKQIQLDSKGLNLIIRPMENYDSIVVALKASRGIAITCEAVIDSDAAIDLDTAISFLNDVCLLLTLSQGCRVTWLYYDVVKPDGEIVETFHGNAITKPLTSLPLIPPKDMTEFLKSGYSNLSGRKEYWQLRKAVDAYTDAKAEGDFLESRALKLVVLMEHLKARYLSQNKRETILNPPEAFNDSASDLIADVKRVLADRFPDSEPNQLEMMANHVRGLNWFPFSRALSEMCRDIGAQTNSRDRRRFINIRNELVHRFAFRSDHGSAWQQFSYLMTFIGKMLLAILGYDGYYYDWTKPDNDQPATRVRLDIAESRMIYE